MTANEAFDRWIKLSDAKRKKCYNDLKKAHETNEEGWTKEELESVGDLLDKMSIILDFSPPKKTR